MISEALTWDDLANDYDQQHGNRPARTLPMETIRKWAEKQKDKYYIDPQEETFHRIKKGEK